MLAQLVQDLVHLERGEDRLDQDRRPDRAARDAERRPGRGRRRRSRAAPRDGSRAWRGRGTARCRARAPRRRCGTGTARSRTGWPRPAAVDEHRPIRRGASRAAGRAGSRSARRAGTALPVGRSNASVPRTASRSGGLPADDVRPGRRQRVLEVGHEHPGARVERVDHHLRLGRAGDLDPPVVEVGAAPARPSSRRRGRRRSRPGSPAATPASSSAWRSSRRRSRSSRVGPNRRWRSATTASASGVRTSSAPGTAPRRTSTPCRERRPSAVADGGPSPR